MQVGDLVKQNHQATNVPQRALGVITHIDHNSATVHFFGYGSFWLYQRQLKHIDRRQQ